MNTESMPGDAAAVRWGRVELRDLVSFCKKEGCACSVDEPLARHTSMGVGGPAAAMVWPPHPDAVAAVVSWISTHGLSWRVLGGGTNVLVGDRGVDDAVINLTRLTEGAHVEDHLATFPAGVPTAQAMSATLRDGLDGLVWATGLPGTLGGAVAGNAGCWGGEMATTVDGLKVVTSAGRWLEIAADELSWSYRRLDLTEAAGTGAVIVAATMALAPADPAALAARSEELQARKRLSQPVGARNSGCVFRNPDADTSAGWLIDQAGCKGERVGAAEISTVHANFLINRGGATSADIEELIEHVKEEVRSRFGILLEEEIRRW
jgi:UDP-N-acetylmuramate dehydrogenase